MSSAPGTQPNCTDAVPELCVYVQNDELQELQALSGRTGASKQSGNHSSRVVDNLRSQLNSTTSEFKTVLEVRREALQASTERRNLFASSAPQAGAACISLLATHL